MNNDLVRFATEMLLYCNKYGFDETKDLLLFNSRFDNVYLEYNHILLKITKENNTKKIKITIPKMEINITYTELELIFKICDSIINTIESAEEDK